MAGSHCLSQPTILPEDRRDQYPSTPHLKPASTSRSASRGHGLEVCARIHPLGTLLPLVLVTFSLVATGCTSVQQPHTRVRECQTDQLEPPYENLDTCHPVAVLEAAVRTIFDYARYGGPTQAFHAARPLIEPTYDRAAQDAVSMWAPPAPERSCVQSVRVAVDDHPPDTATTVQRIVVVELWQARAAAPVELVVHTAARRTAATTGWRLSRLGVAS